MSQKLKGPCKAFVLQLFPSRSPGPNGWPALECDCVVSEPVAGGLVICIPKMTCLEEASVGEPGEDSKLHRRGLVEVRPLQKEIIKQSFSKNSRQGGEPSLLSAARLGVCLSLAAEPAEPGVPVQPAGVSLLSTGALISKHAQVPRRK